MALLWERDMVLALSALFHIYERKDFNERKASFTYYWPKETVVEKMDPFLNPCTTTF